MFESLPLDDVHDLEPFTCGQPSLDRWLKESARLVQRKRLARTYVWQRESHVVVAYYTLCPHLVERPSLPRKLSRGDPEQIPAILLARLALDVNLQGQGLGSELLVDALSRAVSATSEAGGRYVVVDAIDEDAAKFYARYDFVPIPDTAPQRLVQKVSDIAMSLRP